MNVDNQSSTEGFLIRSEDLDDDKERSMRSSNLLGPFGGGGGDVML